MAERNFQSQFDAPPFWHRSRLRGFNGLGFAITLALALWLLLAGVGQLAPSRKPEPLTIPMIYMVVAGIALHVTLILFAVILFRFLWRGVDFSHYKPRVYLFMWSIAGLLFFALQGLVLLLFGARPIPNVPEWSMAFMWFLCPFGVVTFLILAYVNSELPHEEGDEDWEGEHADTHDGYDGHDLEPALHD